MILPIDPQPLARSLCPSSGQVTQPENRGRSGAWCPGCCGLVTTDDEGRYAVHTTLDYLP